MTNEEKYLLLTVHKENLSKAATFEEYRDAHTAYIDMLIEHVEADINRNNATLGFLNKTNKEIAQ